MPTTETTPAAPEFLSVSLADLPKAKRERSPENDAYARAMFAKIADGKSAAVEPTIIDDRKTAAQRQAKVKRLLSPLAPAGKSIGTRILDVVDNPAVEGGHGGYRVAAFLQDAQTARGGRPRKSS
jgi:hypothetical protein